MAAWWPAFPGRHLGLQRVLDTDLALAAALAKASSLLPGTLASLRIMQKECSQPSGLGLSNFSMKSKLSYKKITIASGLYKYNISCHCAIAHHVPQDHTVKCKMHHVCIMADEDIPSIDTPAAPTAKHIQGRITRARAKKLNYQVLSFLGTLSHIHENMMLPKSDMFVILRNDGPTTRGPPLQQRIYVYLNI
jgi:hypothetical protein